MPRLYICDSKFLKKTFLSLAILNSKVLLIENHSNVKHKNKKNFIRHVFFSENHPINFQVLELQHTVCLTLNFLKLCLNMKAKCCRPLLITLIILINLKIHSHSIRQHGFGGKF